MWSVPLALALYGVTAGDEPSEVWKKRFQSLQADFAAYRPHRVRDGLQFIERAPISLAEQVWLMLRRDLESCYAQAEFFFGVKEKTAEIREYERRWNAWPHQLRWILHPSNDNMLRTIRGLASADKGARLEAVRGMIGGTGPETQIQKNEVWLPLDFGNVDEGSPFPWAMKKYARAFAEALSEKWSGREFVILIAPDPETEPYRTAISPLIYDENYVVRATALRFASGVPRQEWERVVIESLDSESAHLRYTAANICGRQKLHRASPKLARLLYDPQRDVSSAAAGALAKLDSVPIRKVLLAALDSDIAGLRSLINEVAGLKMKEAIPRIEALLNHRDPDVAKGASFALETLRNVKLITGLLGPSRLR